MDQLRPQLKPVRRGFGALSGLGIVFLVACSNGQPGRLPLTARVDAAPAGRVDSIIPAEEALRRFVSGVPVVTELDGGAPARDALVASFVEAVARRDQPALAGMIVSRAEYGHIYYPSSSYSRKPYELPPEIAWMLNQQNSEKAISRVVQRLGGNSLQLVGYTCGDSVTESINRLWRDCRVSFRERPGAPEVARQLFGSIIERDGEFKFLSYASDF